ncbi:MAG: hypothetical protein JWQ35_654 [Bacteriovoracaceae bacterium]|nr:hypothetical protein [Bacteriovoracaceae bacterium]
MSKIYLYISPLFLPFIFACGNSSEPKASPAPSTSQPSSTSQNKSAQSNSANKADILKSFPTGAYKKVSDLVALPEFVPGLGILYADPSTLPNGPYLGYDSNQNLISVTYMISITDMESHKNFETLGKNLPELKINHTELMFNPGHPGFEEPHYHFVLWLINPTEKDKIMKQGSSEKK